MPVDTRMDLRPHAVLIEPDEHVRRVLERLLAAADLTVSVAQTCTDAAAIAGAHAIDLLVCAVRPHQLTAGSDCTHRLRALRPAMRVLFVGERDAMEEASQTQLRHLAGIDASEVILKPFSPSDLTDRARRLAWKEIETRRSS